MSNNLKGIHPADIAIALAGANLALTAVVLLLLLRY
jgi:hypothetical protein